MASFDSLRGLAASQDGVVTTVQALRAGLTRHQVRQLCRSGRWRRLARGCFLLDVEASDDTLRMARIRAAVASLGPKAVVVLDTAAELYGMAGLRRASTVHVSIPVDEPRPQRLGDHEIVVHQLTIDPADIGMINGIPVTLARRTVADVILRADRFAAVSTVDSALNQKLITAADLPLVEAALRGRRGAIAARRHLAEVDGRSQSPLETRTRLCCVDGKVPPDVLQLEVRDGDGYLLGIGDLGWRRARVIAEADGRGPHGIPEAIFADRHRQNRLVNAGWTVLRFTWADTLRPGYIPHIVKSALTRPHH